MPTCASPFLTRVLRDEWGFRGYVTSDSGALENIHNNHNYTNSSLRTVPVALRDGQTDVCSGAIYEQQLLPALAAGLVAREDIDLALSHTLRLRFQLGLFDPPPPRPTGASRSRAWRPQRRRPPTCSPRRSPWFS